MKYLVEKAAHLGWRTSRNLMCLTPWGKGFLFPQQVMAARFGRQDAEYAISVFLHHYRQLSAAGFTFADRILEVGPGRNLGTALLMWSLNHGRSGTAVRVILWDVFPNVVVEPGTMREVARGLLESPTFQQVITELPNDELERRLDLVARGELAPDIRYKVLPLAELAASGDAQDVALVYSHAAIEHIWNIAEFWTQLMAFTKTAGWHSHRIDLADHGNRHTNYIEMLDWSPLEYWLAMRFVPGSVNRWRASQHLAFLEKMGMRPIAVRRETRPSLPSPLRIHRTFRSLTEDDLRTTALDVVGIKAA